MDSQTLGRMEGKATALLIEAIGLEEQARARRMEEKDLRAFIQAEQESGRHGKPPPGLPAKCPACGQSTVVSPDTEHTREPTI